MKHLKKLAALLLVGVLALSLLTACGGGGGSTSADAQAEAAVMTAIKLGNFSSSFTYVPHIEDGKFGGTVIAKCDYKNTDLAKLIKTVTNINSHHVDKWSEVGVVVRTFDGQTYIAISVVFKT